MIYSFHTFKHWLQTKLYHAVLNIQKERDENHFSDIIGTMKKIGNNSSIRKGSLFGGMEYMEIGDNCHFGKNAWVEAIDHYGEQIFHPSFVIGDNFSMQYNCHIGCIERIDAEHEYLRAGSRDR